ncbi:MAG: hypothetical protein CMJ28_05905 [Phycisphaerae bacterium]|nr:hypothetical protein [Phycisphaerae bacterium]
MVFFLILFRSKARHRLLREITFGLGHGQSVPSSGDVVSSLQCRPKSIGCCLGSVQGFTPTNQLSQHHDQD